ncbi:transposase (fragment) [Pseudodesulfovibrio profundus]|uniref:Transposase n=2 Tax=Pseudodesulfovibrio profundus TaxID=57320 RepID=A0A2C8FC86_9BACT
MYNNRIRLGSSKGTEAAKLRTELAERSFQHTLDRGGMRKTWLRGQENVQKHYLMHIAGFNLGLLMRELTGYGTLKGAADAWNFVFVGFGAENCWIWLVFAAYEDRSEEWLPFAVVSRVAG